MTPSEAWKTILSKLGDKPMEFPTVPKVNRTPVWFSAKANGNTILIDRAKVHKPSSKISAPRKIMFEEFRKVFPIYLRRENGDQVSHEAASVTFNQVYCYSLIKHLCKETKEVG